MARITTNELNTRITALEAAQAETKAALDAQGAQLSQILSLLEAQAAAPKAQPKAEKKATKKSTSAKPKEETEFHRDVIVRRAMRTEEERQAAREAAIAKSNAAEAARTRKLEKALGLKANTLQTTLVSTYELAELGIKISKRELKAIKAECRA